MEDYKGRGKERKWNEPGGGEEVKMKKRVSKGKYEAKLNFPEGLGSPNQNTVCGRGMDIFWNNTT